MLLHVCCAPDAIVPFRDLKSEGSYEEIVGYFYGSNVHPEDEYRRRADAVIFLSKRENVAVSMGSYDPEEWFAAAAPYAEEPEGGARCALCFALQLRAAAAEARKWGAAHLCTTLTISPHKDVALLSRLGGEIAASRGLLWDDRIWRKKGGFLRSVQISQKLGLYRQNYCGCLFSRGKSFGREKFQQEEVRACDVRKSETSHRETSRRETSA